MSQHFLKEPNLPQNRVSLVAISDQEPMIYQSLKDKNIQCIRVNHASNLQLPVSSHSDMNILHLSNNYFATNKENTRIINNLKNNGAKIEFLSNIESIYPKDVKLNICIIGDSVICNSTHIDPHVLEYFHRQGKNIIHVNQGYSRCSIAIVNKTTIMTSDKSIASACYSNGFKVLFLEQGDIILKGYDYGFIGGCCGLIDKNLLAFTGNILKYNQSSKILPFLEDNNCKYVCLTDAKLIDIGGILPLKEIDM